MVWFFHLWDKLAHCRSKAKNHCLEATDQCRQPPDKTKNYCRASHNPFGFFYTCCDDITWNSLLRVWWQDLGFALKDLYERLHHGDCGLQVVAIAHCRLQDDNVLRSQMISVLRKGPSELNLIFLCQGETLVQLMMAWLMLTSGCWDVRRT